MTPTFLALLMLGPWVEPTPPVVLHGVRPMSSASAPALGQPPGIEGRGLTPVTAHAYFPAPKNSSEYSQ